MSSNLSSYVKQEKNFLITNKDCKLTILFSDFEKDDFEIREDEETIYFPPGIISQIEFSDILFNLILDYSVIVQLVNEYELNKTKAVINYLKGETILEVPLEAGILTEQIRYVQRLLGGKEIFKNVNHLFLKLFKIYGEISPVDLVHMEILLGQCLRDSKQLELPARLGKTWNPTMVNMKQVVFNTSFLQSLSFENINEAIKVGLISEEPIDKSILEKVLTGELVEERKKK